jgi:2-polyprenyl-3-methyl-5-hydroxy-6-metoxy-1,4-benzoquinol methylase
MSSTIDPGRREIFARRMTDATSGAFDVAAAYLGLRLDLYRSLADHGPTTAAELAERTSTNERLVREWLEQQAATEVLEATRDDATQQGGSARDGEAGPWRFALPTEHAAVLLDPDAIDGMGGTVRSLVADLAMVPRLVESFRTGRGIPYAEYGPDEADGQAMSTRPIYRSELSSWFVALPEVSARLAGGKVLDVGCGLGWSTVSIAKAFPTAHVDGVDFDLASIDAARELAEQEGMSDRVRFEVRDAAELAGAGYDLVTFFEMLHDLARPVEALRAASEALAPGGVVLVADEITADAFAGPADEADRRHYGWSLLMCLPSSMSEPGSAATGAVIRPATVRAYADAAGFASTEILPIESAAFRFYLLRPKAR